MYVGLGIIKFMPGDPNKILDLGMMLLLLFFSLLIPQF
jgi:hypothetical protein